MDLRVIGDTKLNKDAKCPYCKQLAQPAGTTVQISKDMETGLQYASFSCKSCKEIIITR